MYENIKENIQKKESGILTKLSRVQLVILVVVFLLTISLIVVLFSFFRTQNEHLKLAVDIRDSVLEAVLHEENILGDYDSMIFAPDLAVYNTCSNNFTFLNDEFSWSRDWLHLRIFDSLHSDFARRGGYERQTRILENSLYEQYSDPDGEYLSLYSLLGNKNSYCTPYFIFDKFKNQTPSVSYSSSYDLSRELCHDFYNLDLINNTYCKDDVVCIGDDIFYSNLEDLFYNHNDDFDRESHYPVSLIIDNYIVGYTKDSQILRDFSNLSLLEGIAHFKKEVDAGLFDTCVDNFDYYSGLLRAMSIKGSYLTDDFFKGKHQEMQGELLNLCNLNSYDLLARHSSLGEKIEFYYVFGDDGFVDELEVLVHDAIEKEVFSKSSGFKSFTFLHEEANKDFDSCKDLKIDLNENLKNSLYILIYSIYGI